MEETDHFRIRPAETEDLPAIGELMASANMVIQFGEENCLIAERGGNVAGFARIEFCSGNPYLRPIVIATQHKRQGVGKALIQSIIAREEGLTVIARGSAAGFYNRMGFESIEWDEIPSNYSNECIRCPDLEICCPVPMEFTKSRKVLNETCNADSPVLIKRQLLPFEEALAICLSEAHEPLETEPLPLMASLGRILREDIVSRYFIPPFNKSIMDGYAVKCADVENASLAEPVRLKVIGEAPAGTFNNKVICAGESIRIMTGAPVPEGADMIIPFEDTVSIEENEVLILGCFRDNHFIIEKGKDLSPGQVIINKGEKITPAVMGMIANCGISHVHVSRKPRIGILSTGNELVPPGHIPEQGQIFDINGYSLYGLAKSFGAEVSYLGIAKDTLEDVIRFIESYNQWDILILSGGVSVGDYDVVHDAFQKLGVDEIFWRVNIKPGKPLFFGKKNSSLIFGLPGNPVSAITNFLMFILPVMDTMTGKASTGLKKGYARVLNNCLLKPGRRKFLRGKLDYDRNDNGVFIMPEQNSGIFRPLVESDVLLEIDDDVKYVKEGDIVKIYYLNIDAAS